MKRLLPSLMLGLLFTGTSVAIAQEPFNWKKFSGQTISVSLAKQPWSDFITPKIPEFEQLTGIKVKLEVLPEDQNRQKMAIAFSSGSGVVDMGIVTANRTARRGFA